MPAPYSYTSQIALVDPTARFMEGVQAAQQQKAEAQKRQRQQEFNQALSEAYGSDDPVRTISSLMMRFPEAGENINQSLEQLSQAQRTSIKNAAIPAYNYILSGQPKKALDLLITQATAYRNSGNESIAKNFEDLAGMLVDDNEVNKISFGAAVRGALGDDFDKIFRGGQYSGLYEKETDQIAQEDRLRTELGKALQPFEEFDSQYLNLKAVFDGSKSKAYNTEAEIKKAEEGFSDIALITLFNKILDPRSVVRGEEFDNAANTAGLFSWGQTILQNLLQNKGSVLRPEQRQAIFNIANYVRSAIEQKKKQSLEDKYVIAVRQGLNPKGVFGKQFDEEIYKSAQEFFAGRQDTKRVPRALIDLGQQVSRFGSPLTESDVELAGQPTGESRRTPPATPPARSAGAPRRSLSQADEAMHRAAYNDAREMLAENPNDEMAKEILRASSRALGIGAE